MNKTTQPVSDSDATHMLMVAISVNTAKHLRERHGVDPSDDKHENAGLHMEAHGYGRDAKTVSRWSDLFGFGGGIDGWNRRRYGTGR